MSTMMQAFDALAQRVVSEGGNGTVRVSGLKLRALSVSVLALALIGCDKAEGIAAVERLCAKDGGEHIYETTFVGGYLAPSGWARCVACGSLPDGAFEFIDMYIEEGQGYREIRGPGYYRYSLSTVGDPRCELFDSDRAFQQQKAGKGYREDECLAVEPIAAADISEYGWTPRTEVIRVGGVNVTSGQMIIFHVDSDRVLAKHQSYAFTSKFTDFVETMLSGSSNPDARCGADQWVSITDLLQRVLRDEQKATATD